MNGILIWRCVANPVPTRRFRVAKGRFSPIKAPASLYAAVSQLGCTSTTAGVNVNVRGADRSLIGAHEPHQLLMRSAEEALLTRER